MNTAGSDIRVCERCGAPLGRHLGEGLCSRCIARFSLLGQEDGSQDPVSEVPHAVAKTRFGDYELLEEIAHGGMGVVYRSRQVSLKRIVAVKMLLFGQFAGKAAFDRFRAEAETAARLQHPNIVAVHEIGETGGQPYFSMDYVAGRNLADLVRDRPLPARQAAGYVKTIAEAVQYAHTQGVLHRDLKPANVLIDEFEEPRVTDFGLARQLAGDSGLTLTGQVLGSPNFMPPEQGAGKQARVGPASDIYGLGALLYYVLTARPPFVAETFEATLAQVLNKDPAAPRQLNPNIPLDLETICLKCLEKDPARRYASAAELADELDRFLRDEPILARSIGPAGKAWRWCRRKPVLAGMTAGIVTLLLTVTAVSVTAARRIAAEARRTAHNARELRLNLYVADMSVAYQAIADNNLGLASELIGKYLPTTQQVQDGRVPEAALGWTEDLRGWEWRYLWSRCQDDSLWTFRGHSNSCSCAVSSPDGKTLVTASSDRTARIWDLGTKRTLHCLTGFAGPIPRNSVVFSPNGGVLAIADGADIHVFDATTWSRLRTLPNPTSAGRVNSLAIAISPDGRTLTCNALGELRRWDTTAWERWTNRIPVRIGDFNCLFACSPDGQRFATAASDGITVWDDSSGTPKPHFSVGLLWPGSIAFSPDGRLVAAGGLDQQVIVWDAKDGREVLRLDAGPYAWVIAFSPDSSRLATGKGGTIFLWDLDGGTLIASLSSRGGVTALVFSPDGRNLIAGSDDGAARLWAVAAEASAGRWSPVGRPLDLSADGNTLVLLSTNFTVEYWDVRAGKPVQSFTIPDDLGQLHDRAAVSVSPDGRLLAVVGTNETAYVWDLGSPGRVTQIALDPPPQWPIVAFSPDSRLLAISCIARDSGGVGRTVVYDVQWRKLQALPDDDCYRPAFSPDGRILATGSANNVQLWSVPDLRPLGGPLRGHTWTISGLGFSPDGSLLASAGRDRDIRLWDVGTGRLRALLSTPSQNSISPRAAFSPDGRTLATREAGQVNLWNVATAKPILTIRGLSPYVGAPLFSSDGITLVVGGSLFARLPAPVQVLRAPSMDEIDATEHPKARSP